MFGGEGYELWKSEVLLREKVPLETDSANHVCPFAGSQNLSTTPLSSHAPSSPSAQRIHNGSGTALARTGSHQGVFNSSPAASRAVYRVICPPPPKYLLDGQVQCRIFRTVFNPDNLRLGNKILRQRLRGPSMAAYYPRKMGTIKELQRAYPGYEIFDEDEEERFEKVRIKKSRGKGAPKKKRTAAGELFFF